MEIQGTMTEGGTTDILGGEPAHKITHYWTGKQGDSFGHPWKCPKTGSYYHLWFYGRQIGAQGKTQWWASGKEAEVGSCTEVGNTAPSGPEGAEEVG
jgi:hypothetical protein